MNQVQGVLLAALMLPTIAGCGKPPPPPLVPVSGTVKLDGKPVAGVQVTFFPADGSLEWVGRGTTDKQGAFELRYRDQQTGVPAGDYKVTLSTERPDVEGAETFSPEYHNPEQTILAVTVPAGGTKFDLAATSPKK